MQITARRMVQALLHQRSSTACMLGTRSSANNSRRGSTPKVESASVIFLHRIALVLKQHHHHRDAQQHLRHRAEQATAHSRTSRGQDSGSDPRPSARPTARARRPAPETRANRACGRSAGRPVSSKEERLPVQCLAGLRAAHPDGRRRSRCVPRNVRRASTTPTAPTAASYQRNCERSAHHARRNEDAQRHRHQKQLADEKRQRRCREKHQERSAASTPPTQIATRGNMVAGSARRDR